MRTFISLIIVITLALFSLWFQNLFKETPIIKAKKDSHFPDYFMENFSITNLNQQGDPAYILNARRLEHFADDNSAELQQPVIEFRGKDQWSISAKRAIIYADQTVIHFYENVQLRRTASKTRGPLSIDTEYLKIHTENKTAETDQLAHLKTGDLELHSLGMVFDNRQGILKLKSTVNGQYAPAK